MRGGSASRSDPLPFIYDFSRKRYPFGILSISFLEHCNHFNCCKCTVVLIGINHKTERYLDFIKPIGPFHRPKSQISLPFRILQRVNSLTLHKDSFHMTSWLPYWCTKQWIGGHVCVQKNPVGIVPFSLVKIFFYSKEFAKLLTTWLKTIYTWSPKKVPLSDAASPYRPL